MRWKSNCTENDFIWNGIFVNGISTIYRSYLCIGIFVHNAVQYIWIIISIVSGSMNVSMDLKKFSLVPMETDNLSWNICFCLKIFGDFSYKTPFFCIFLLECCQRDLSHFWVPEVCIIFLRNFTQFAGSFVKGQKGLRNEPHTGCTPMGSPVSIHSSWHPWYGWGGTVDVYISEKSCQPHLLKQRNVMVCHFPHLWHLCPHHFESIYQRYFRDLREIQTFVIRYIFFLWIPRNHLPSQWDVMVYSFAHFWRLHPHHFELILQRIFRNLK